METAIEILLRSVKGICPALTDGELSQFASKHTVVELNKKDVFIQAGKVQKTIGFIATGLVRSFFIDNSGNEITVGFYSENDYATHYPSFITQKPSNYTIQCLEPTTMVCLSFPDMQSVYSEMPAYF